MTSESVPVQVRPATAADLDALAELFDAYRQFYEQAPDREAARRFLQARFAAGQSALLLGELPSERADEPPAGFCQLYPSFCSIEAAPTWILSDLFVAPQARRLGVGEALLRAAQAHGLASGACRLELSTAHTNLPAQALYESLGWQRDAVYRVYSLPLHA